MQEENLYKEVDIRAKKIQELKDMGINPFADKFNATHTIVESRKLEDGGKTTVAGRIIFRRAFGKFMFIQISDVFDKIQVSLSINEIPEDKYKFFKDYVDIGDYVGISGEMYTTQTGEKTIRTLSICKMKIQSRTVWNYCFCVY